MKQKEAQKVGHKRYLEILQEEIAIGIMEVKKKTKQDIFKKIDIIEKNYDNWSVERQVCQRIKQLLK